MIGIFSQAFGTKCWAHDVCYYHPEGTRVVFQIFPSERTITEELDRLRQHRMQVRERALEEDVRQKTAELMQAKIKLEEYSIDLEKKVAERTAELLSSNKKLRSEIEIRQQAEAEKERLIIELQASIKEINTLSGLLPICSSCKKIRDDKGYWNLIEEYIQNHSGAQFSHGICDECAEKLYGHETWYREWRTEKIKKNNQKT